MTTLRHITCLATALLLFACGGCDGEVADATQPVETTIPIDSTSQVVPVEGGRVSSRGLSLEFPPGALSASTNVQIETLQPRDGSIASFQLAPAGKRLSQPVALSYSQPGLPAQAMLFWLIDDERLLLPTTRAGDTLSARIGSLGFGPGGLREVLQSPETGRARALAAGPPARADIEVQVLNCEFQASQLELRLRTPGWEISFDRAIQLGGELEALRTACAGLRLETVVQRACLALATATANADVLVADSFPTFRSLVAPMLTANAIVQRAASNCDPALETRATAALEAKFDQMVTFFEARFTRAEFTGEATRADMRELFTLEVECGDLGLEAPCLRITTSLYPRLLDVLRASAFRRCIAVGRALSVSELLQFGALRGGGDKFFDLARYSDADLEADATYCTAPALDLRVFADAQTVPVEIVGRARTLAALGNPAQLGAYHRGATIGVPLTGSLTVAGQVKALDCPAGSVGDDVLVIRLDGRELTRRGRNGDRYTLDTQPLDFVVDRDIRRVGLTPDATASRTLTVVREGGCVGGETPTYGEPFTLFALTLNLDAADPPPPSVPPSAWTGQLTLRYDFSGLWDEVNQRDDACANDLDPATRAACRNTNTGSSSGSIVYVLSARTPGAIDIGATSGRLALTVQSVTGLMNGTQNATIAGTDGPCAVTGTSAYSFAAVPTSATPRRDWGLAVRGDGLLTLSTLSTGASPHAITTTLRNNNVGSGSYTTSAGCPGGERTQTTGNSQNELVVLLPPGVFTATVDPTGSAWQGSQSQPFTGSGVACDSLGNVVQALLRFSGHTGTATCTATVTATWDLQRQ